MPHSLLGLLRDPVRFPLALAVIGPGRCCARLPASSSLGLRVAQGLEEVWLSRIEGWSAGERHLQLKGASAGRRFR
jgi:hypothetical protein